MAKPGAFDYIGKEFIYVRGESKAEIRWGDAEQIKEHIGAAAVGPNVNVCEPSGAIIIWRKLLG